MPSNFLEGFTKGFSKAGAAISAEKSKIDSETEAYIKRQREVQNMKTEAELQLYEIKRKRAERALMEAKLYRNGQLLNTMPTNAQATALFGNQTAPVDEPVIDPTQENIAATDGTGLPAPLQAIAPTSDPQAPYTDAEYEEALNGMSQKTIESSDGQTLHRMADAKARQIARTRQYREASLSNQTGNLETRRFSEGLDETGKPLSIYEQDKETIDARLAESGLPKEIVSPLLFAKNPVALDAAKEAFKAASKYYYGSDFQIDLQSVEQVNNGFAEMLNLARDAQTGLISGNINLIADKLGNDTGVAQLQKFAAFLAPRMRVEGSGSSSDIDVKMFFDSLAAIDTPEEINEQTMSRLLNLGARAQAKMEFNAYLHDKVVLASPGESTKLFNEYWQANPAFSKVNGNLVENPGRVSFEEWIKQGPQASKDSNIDTRLESMDSSTNPENKLKGKYDLP